MPDTSQAPAPAAPFYHVAFLVADLDAAIADWARSPGLRFHQPVHSRLDLESGGVAGDADIRLTFSAGGPPYVELIEMTSHPLFSPARGAGFHHIGVVAGDLAETIAASRDAGGRPGTSLRSADGTVLAWFAPQAGSGGWTEFVSPAYCAQFTRWMAGLARRG